MTGTGVGTGAAVPLISVVMPIHDAAAYLPEALASIRAQTHPNLDIVCVDDASTDGSAAVVERAMAGDDRIRLLRTGGDAAGGPGRARNLALDTIRGEWLAFLDADDTMPPHALERMLATVRSTGSDLVTGRVVRLTGTHTWPSALHERAVPNARLRTHITRQPSLLYDTTSWNKLYRTALWHDHGLRYPEAVLYEDVPVMVEAHLRARSVDLISDVVYHWRRREDGVLSITQQRLLIGNLEDRMRSLVAVRELLAGLAPPRLSEAFAKKSLTNDIRLYVHDLLRADRDYQERFATLVGDYLTGVPEAVLRRIPPQLAAEYHLVRTGQLDRLLDLLEHARQAGGRLPAIRRGLSMHLDVGPAAAAVPSAITRVRRRLPLRVGVDSVTGQGDSIVVEGFAFIDSVPMTTPLSQVRRLRLTDRAGGRALSVWLTARRHERAAARHSRPETDYTWCGFRAEIPVRRLAPPPGSTGSSGATWSVVVQALSPLAAKGAALGPPAAGAAWFPPVHRTADGLVVSAGWGSDQRLRLTARRSPGAVTGARETGGRLRLSVRLRPGPARAATGLVLRTDGEEPLLVPFTGPVAGDGRMVAEVAVADLAGWRRGAPFTIIEIAAATPGGPVRLDGEFDDEVVVATADDTLLVRADPQGRAEVAVTPPRVAVTGAEWAGDDLVVSGIITLPAGEAAGLVWHNGRGERLAGEEVRTGDTFRTVFRPLAVPGPEGAHPLGTGSWDLYRYDAGSGREVRAFVARGAQPGVEQARRDVPLDLRLWIDRHSLVSMTGHAVPPSERGAYAQEQLRRGPYRRARTASLREAVLFESWQGKQFSDNPRALAEEALRRGDRRELIVAVADRSVPVAAGLRPVLRWSREYYEALATAGTIIANDSLTQHYVKRDDQLYLQTWHGTPLKRIGHDIGTIHFRNQRYLDELSLEVRKWDQLISPNPYTTEILRRAFRYEGEILETGYPRNDLLLSPAAAQVRERTRRWLGLEPGTTAVLWAPTWRDNQFGEGSGYSFPMVLDLERLGRQLGDDHVVLFRGHHLISSSLRQMPVRAGFFRNVSHYPDIRDLYCASDVLVTDYSSSMFDYALTGRPIVHLAWDLESYRDELRGLYVDLAEVAAGPVVADGDALVGVLRDLPAVTAAHAGRYATFRQRFNGLEDGSAAARVWDQVDATAARRAGAARPRRTA